MNKVLTHPKGFAITVASWENDGDYRATKTIYVKSAEETHIIVSIARLFRSYWEYATVKGETSFDNMYNPHATELKAMFQSIAKIIGSYPLFEKLYGWDDFVMPTEQEFADYDSEKEIEEDENNPVWAMHDAVFELLGDLGLNGMQDDQYTRVAENISVYYYEKDVYTQEVII